MSKFKSGDKVMPINMARYTDRNSDQRKEMIGRTLVVRSVHNDEFTSVVFAGFYGEGVWQWHPDDLRLVSETPAQPVPQKPLRRGDLVEFNGDVCVVISEGPDRGGDYWVVSLTGKPNHYWVNIDEFERIGSIRKKIKRIKNEMEGRNAT